MLLVPIGVAVAMGVATIVGPPESVVRDRPGQLEPVVRSTAVCPYVGGEARAVSHVGVLPLVGTELDPAEAEPEPVVVQPLLGTEAEPSTLLTAATPGVLAAAEVDTDSAVGYAVRAAGALSPGLSAEQSMLAQGPDFRGLVTGRCSAPAREHWFVGGSGEVGRRGRLVLSNPTTVPAVVDVSVWDETGPVDPPATHDIAVPAQGQQVFLLDALDPSAAQVAVRVAASQGRVAAALEVRESDGLEPLGVSMLPEAAAPSTDIVVPGVPGHGQRLLRLLAPGDTDAIVSLRLLGADGPFSPVDQDVLTVTAGTVLEVPIGDTAGEAAVSVALDSDTPITAPLDGPAAALFGRAGSGLATRLLVSSVGDMPARAQVRTLAADGTVAAEQAIDVPGGSTVPVALELPAGVSWATVVVEPADPGTIVVTREMVGSDDDGALLDLMPLVSPAIRVQVPEVAAELPTGLAPAGPIDR
jgi:hypothetical protein